MIPPPFPADEAERLEVLRSLELLDTPAEERFDRMTRIACALFQVPIALVSLIDEDRQWLKSCSGLEGVTQTSRDISFCGHAILGDEVFVIENALEDERFFDNPLVTDAPYIRFYAGCPLLAPNGHKLGTLCIIDREARKFDTEQRQNLRDLASVVEREISLTELLAIDELTRLPNHLGFTLIARAQLALVQRHRSPAAMAMFDLEGLGERDSPQAKKMNENMLRRFARALEGECSATDSFGRTGDGEFLAFFGDSDRLGVEQRIARLRDRLQRGRSGKEPPIRFCHGVVEVDANRGSSLAALTDAAEMLLRAGRRSGRRG